METFGFDSCTTENQLRRAWRRTALRLHPDLNPEPGAAERFKAARRAYRRRLRVLNARRRAPVPKTPARTRLRYGCGTCGDSYAFDGDCPRCGVALFDGVAPRPAPDPRVDALIATLEDPTPRRENPIPAELRVPLASAGLALFGAWHLAFAMAPLGVLMVGFAGAALAIEGWERARAERPAWLAS